MPDRKPAESSTPLPYEDFEVYDEAQPFLNLLATILNRVLHIAPNHNSESDGID
jgi:hypothetical protein